MHHKKEILQKRFKKLDNHYSALKDYKQLIDKICIQKDIFQVDVFQRLDIQEKALLDAYLKRFSSIQDFLGAKIFSDLLDISGISCGKMSEVFYQMEKGNYSAYFTKSIRSLSKFR